MTYTYEDLEGVILRSDNKIQQVFTVDMLQYEYSETPLEEFINFLRITSAGMSDTTMSLGTFYKDSWGSDNELVLRGWRSITPEDEKVIASARAKVEAKKVKDAKAKAEKLEKQRKEYEKLKKIFDP